MKGRILVLGSSNVDFILRISRFHHPGETITGQGLATAFGGKGANQAIAARRLGGEVVFLTKLGSDSFGTSYRKYLTQEGLPARFLLRDSNLPTGVAVIELIPKGENRIIVSPGANASLLVRDLLEHPDVWRAAGVFVVQLETPLNTVKKGLNLGRKMGCLTVLNPADLDRVINVGNHGQTGRSQEEHIGRDDRASAPRVCFDANCADRAGFPYQQSAVRAELSVRSALPWSAG